MRNATFAQKFWLGVGLISGFGGPWMGALGVLGAAGAIALIAPQVQAATLDTWQFDPNTNQLEVILPEGVQPRYFLVAEPTRIVIDLPNVQVGLIPTEGNYEGSIRQIRVAQFQPDLTRMVIQLAPDIQLTPGQVNLVSTGTVAGGVRWVLQPLIAGAGTVPVAGNPVPASSVPENLRTATAPIPTMQPQPAPEAAVVPPTPSNAPALPPAMPTAAGNPTVSVPSVATTSPASSAATASLPPLEPGAVPVPLQSPVATSSEQTAATEARSPSSRTQAAAARRQARQARRAAEREAAANRQQATSAIETATTPAPAAPSNRETNRSADASAAPSATAPALPPATFTPTAAEGTVQVPGLNATSAATANAETARQIAPPAPEPITIASNGDVIPFGAPLPGSEPRREPAASPPSDSSNGSRRNGNSSRFEDSGGFTRDEDLDDENFNDDDFDDEDFDDEDLDDEEFADDEFPSEIAVNSTFDILIPSGTRLNLFYPGEIPLELTDENQQEVLLLAQTVFDRQGNLIAPVNSQVIGRFETGRGGSRFVAQALRLQGENVRIDAESESLSGRRQLSTGRIIRDSAAGALAGLLLGATTGIGALAGLAAGAVAGAGGAFVNAPQPAVIQPDQIIEVQFTTDLDR
jgi:uncharacterized membrane protein